MKNSLQEIQEDSEKKNGEWAEVLRKHRWELSVQTDFPCREDDKCAEELFVNWKFTQLIMQKQFFLRILAVFCFVFSSDSTFNYWDRMTKEHMRSMNRGPAPSNWASATHFWRMLQVRLKWKTEYGIVLRWASWSRTKKWDYLQRNLTQVVCRK